jgi:hypothetical protein
MDNILRLSAAFNNSLTNAFKPRKQINRSTQQQEAHQPDAESTRDGETQENQRASENILRDNNIPEHGNIRPTVRTDGEPRNQEKVVSTNERIGTQGKSVETENRIKAVQDLFKNIRWHRGERHPRIFRKMDVQRKQQDLFTRVQIRNIREMLSEHYDILPYRCTTR